MLSLDPINASPHSFNYLSLRTFSVLLTYDKPERLLTTSPCIFKNMPIKGCIFIKKTNNNILFHSFICDVPFYFPLSIRVLWRVKDGPPTPGSKPPPPEPSPSPQHSLAAMAVTQSESMCQFVFMCVCICTLMCILCVWVYVRVNSRRTAWPCCGLSGFLRPRSLVWEVVRGLWVRALSC